VSTDKQYIYSVAVKGISLRK